MPCKPTKLVEMKMIEQYIVKGELKPGGQPAMVFENFESAFRAALKCTTVEDMIIVTMPDGTEYTLLQRPRLVRDRKNGG
jgi:hypothetical protein